MDKKALQNYAVWAKNNLESQIEIQLKSLGINSASDIKTARVVGDRTVIDGDMNSYPSDMKKKRDAIIELIRQNGYNQVIEEFAYTWFNRIVALRFMEVHDFLPHGFRVLSSRTGGFEPEIMKNLNFVKEDLKLDLSVVSPLLEQGKIDEAYRYVLFRQCKALSSILPMLFSDDFAYLELLLPKALLKGETFITKLLEIDESNFLNDVEVIGWLYQFYISQKKDEVFASKKTITKDTLPAVTQLFTPDWIVRYMAENSVGRIWMESYPNSSLRSEMKYYVDDAKQEEEVQKKIDEIKYKNVNPEDIKIIEPCCGSGHILVYVFDLLYKMYEERGYQKREIPTLILKKNLVGLDVDKRAAQLASFSLAMKARSMNSRFFNEGYYVMPEVFDIWDSRVLIGNDYLTHIKETNLLNSQQIKDIEWLVETFRYGKTIGSLLKVGKKDFNSIKESIDILREKAVITVFNSNFLSEGLNCLSHLLRQAVIMSSKYDVMITNPPYLRISQLMEFEKNYLENNYSTSSFDMFTMFMDTDFVRANGFMAMINQQSWMYLIHFADFRKKYLENNCVVTLLHLGSNTFEDINGEVVQSCSFVSRKFDNRGYLFNIINLKESKSFASKKDDFLQNRCKKYILCSNTILKKQQYIFDYEEKQFDETFVCGCIEDDRAYRGPSFVNNSVLRFWYEVNYNLICQKFSESKKWIFCSRNGGKIRWYTPRSEIIEKRLLLSASNYETQNQEGVLWNDSRFGNPTIIAKPKDANESYESALNLISCDGDDLKMYLCLFNLGYYEEVLKSRINGQHFSPIYIKKLEKFQSNKEISISVNKIIEINKSYEKFFETSIDFKGRLTYFGRLILNNFDEINSSISSYIQICNEEENKIKTIIDEFFFKRSESKNKLLINSITPYEFAVNVISFFVGLIMGRFSLDVEGLAYAGGDWNEMNYISYKPDDDGIVPIYNGLGMEDGLTTMIIGLIKQIYGEDTYKENIAFIADALGKKNDESSEETLNRYLNEGFYPDHLKIYQKRPIYWMFSSGKNGAFKCLIYLHRYKDDTLATINSKYFLNESARLNAEINDARARLDVADGKDRLRLDKIYKTLNDKQKEMIEYGQVLDHMANQYIHLDLDDGVKVNYAKFQGIEIVNDNGAKVKKDLLVPIK